MLRALDLAEALEAGDLTASTVVELIAEAVQTHEGSVKAFAHLDLGAARAAAAAKPGGPLRGLPVAFKDIIDTADMPTEYGSPIWKGWRPRADASIVSMTRAAGGIVLGKTATTEMAFMQPAPTRNPHDLSRSPGGSSAGSAAGVAAGMTPLAFGTQTGGSVVRPASYCGVAALKPSFRLLPTVGVKAQSWTMDTLGLFAARIADVAYGLEAITGRALRVDGRDFGAPTIGLLNVDFAGKAEPESEAALRFAVRAAAKAGAEIVQIETPDAFAKAFDAHSVINQYEAAVSFGWELENHAGQLSDALRTFLRPEKPADVNAYDAARSAAKAARRAAKAVFQEVDVLLTFSSPGAAPDPSSTGTSNFNRLFTLLGAPAANVPGYLTSEGLPVGVQVVAGFGEDLTALAAAQFVESALLEAL